MRTQATGALPSLPPLSAPNDAPDAPTAIAYDSGETAAIERDIAAHEAALSRTVDPRERGRLHMELGRVYEQRVGALGEAASHYAQAYRLDPRDVVRVRAMRRTLIAAGYYEEALPLFDEEVNQTRQAKRRASILYLKARVLEERLDRFDDAFDAFQTALELVPTDPTILRAIERSACMDGRPERLENVYTILANRLSDPAARADALREVARIRELREPRGAKEVYLEILQLDPHDPIALAALGWIAAQQGDGPLLQRIEHAIAATPDVGVDPAVGVAMSLATADPFHGAATEPGVTPSVPEPSLGHRPAQIPTQVEMASAGGAEHLVTLLSRAAEESSEVSQAIELWTEVATLQHEQLEDLQGAVESLSHILELAPRHAATLQFMAGLLIDLERWEESADALEATATITDDVTVALNARWLLARIYDEHLEQPDRALAAVRDVLEHQPRHIEALELMASLLRRRGEGTRALGVLRKLFELREEPRDRAGILIEVARIEIDRGRNNLAVQALRQAVSLDGPAGEAAALFQTLLDDPASWEQYARALGESLQEAERKEEATPEMYLELARVQADSLERPDAAVRLLQRGLMTCGSDPDLALQLARRLRMCGRWEEAVQELRDLAGKEPWIGGVWRELAKAYHAARRPQEVALLLEAAELLTPLGEAERQAVIGRERRPGRARPGSMGRDLLRTLACETGPEMLAGDLLAVLALPIAKLHCATLATLGVSDADRVGPSEPHPLRRSADAVARVMEVSDFELYISRKATRVEVGIGPAPRIIVPAPLKREPEAIQIFELSRAMALVARGIHPLAALSPKEIELLLHATVRVFAPDHGSDEPTSRQIHDLAKRVKAALPRKTRPVVAQHAERVAAAGLPKLGRWRLAAQRSATRAALLLADDLGLAARQLAPQLAEEGADVAEIIASCEDLSDMVGFWGTERSFELRRRLGLLTVGRAAW